MDLNGIEYECHTVPGTRMKHVILKPDATKTKPEIDRAVDLAWEIHEVLKVEIRSSP